MKSSKSNNNIYSDSIDAKSASVVTKWSHEFSKNIDICCSWEREDWQDKLMYLPTVSRGMSNSLAIGICSQRERSAVDAHSTIIELINLRF